MTEAELAFGDGLIRGHDVDSTGAVLVVNAGMWSALTLDRQKRIIESIDCAMASPGYLRRIEVRAEHDTPALYKADASDLYDMRKDGFASWPDAGK